MFLPFFPGRAPLFILFLSMFHVFSKRTRDFEHCLAIVCAISLLNQLQSISDARKTVCDSMSLYKLTSVLFHKVCDLKASQMNVQCNLIQEHMLDEFELSDNAGEANKKICYAKGECDVDHSTVTRWLQEP